MVTERRAIFCAHLRAAREQQGVSLELISASTKISISLLKGLEEGDLSRWPKGLFRRSYIRDYLRAVSLPVDSTLAEFLRMFPDGGGSDVDEAGDADGHEEPVLSLTLADEGQQLARVSSRLLAASIDAGIVLASSGAVAWLIRADFWTCSALLALGYHSVATASFGNSLGSLWCVDRSRTRWKNTTVSTTRPDPLLKKIRRLHRLSARPSRPTARGIGRVPWNAALLRIWTAIRPQTRIS